MTKDLKECPVCGEKTYFKNSKCKSCGYDNSMRIKTQYEISLDTTGNGTVSGATDGDKVPYKYKVTLEATPDSGWEFTSFTVNGVEITTNPVTISILKDTTIVVLFTEE